jgi:NAD(P)-dependent dehydrogenase (short-subunit alcohol dehydrogenase family)
MQLEGKAAMVTGGGRGIGRGIALAYAAAGADVAIVARSSPEPEEVAAEVRRMGCRGLVIAADLTDSQGVATRQAGPATARPPAPGQESLVMRAWVLGLSAVV